jgi:hypothetical protein
LKIKGLQQCSPFSIYYQVTIKTQMLNCLYYKRGCGNPKMTVQTETCGKNKSTMYFANFITQQVTTWFTPISVLPKTIPFNN